MDKPLQLPNRYVDSLGAGASRLRLLIHYFLAGDGVSAASRFEKTFVAAGDPWQWVRKAELIERGHRTTFSRDRPPMVLTLDQSQYFANAVLALPQNLRNGRLGLEKGDEKPMTY